MITNWHGVCITIYVPPKERSALNDGRVGCYWSRTDPPVPVFKQSNA
jgi:hypothetical protein